MSYFFPSAAVVSRVNGRPAPPRAPSSSLSWADLSAANEQLSAAVGRLSRALEAETTRRLRGLFAHSARLRAATRVAAALGAWRASVAGARAEAAASEAARERARRRRDGRELAAALAGAEAACAARAEEVARLKEAAASSAAALRREAAAGAAGRRAAALEALKRRKAEAAAAEDFEAAIAIKREIASFENQWKEGVRGGL